MQLVVGQIVRPHGVRGEVVVEVTTDEPTNRYVPGVALATEPEAAGPLTVESVRPHQGRLIVAFDGVFDRDGAESLRGVRLCVDSADIALPDDPDEFHDFQLVGLAAVSADGDEFGEVVGVVHGPAADLLVLRRPGGAKALVPFVRAIVPTVDLGTRRIVITPPDGLFDL